MASLPETAEILATGVSFADDRLIVELSDGRQIALPLAWYPRLLDSTPEELANWRFNGRGSGIHWPDIDEDLSTEQLILGIKAPVGGIWPGLPRKRECAAQS